jgi:uncharacterized protein YacL
MKHIFFLAVALVAAILPVVNDPSVSGWINGGVTFAVISAFYAILRFTSSKEIWKDFLTSFWGAVIGLIVFGLMWSFFHQWGTSLNQIWLEFAALGVFVVTGAFTVASFFREFKILAPQVEEPAEEEANDYRESQPKILDTSIIIDGRIIDIASAGFVENPLVVPNFVLREIQLISDSPDPIKRNRGRRGLDMLNQLQKRKELTVQISYKDYTETREVDAKLVKLAKEIKGKLITNDFNLNKVAELQGVEVLNINNLASALKPVVLPGEEMEISVVKEGKDENQGIGYLDDGTMVVIENGGKLLNKRVKVSVTSVIQTSAGKMIFTKIVNQ